MIMSMPKVLLWITDILTVDLFLLLIAQAFKHGLKLQEEQGLTI